jgi:hypothetical protein
LTIVRHLRFASQTLVEAYVSDDGFVARLLLAFGLLAIPASYSLLGT